jgi:hypothetical protein
MKHLAARSILFGMALLFTGAHADTVANSRPARAQARQSSAPYTRGTEQAPVYVKLDSLQAEALKPVPPAVAPAKETSTIAGTSTDVALAIFTAALVFVGVLQLFAFVLQARRLHQTIGVMQTAEERQQATDRAQLRAWVGIDSIVLDATNLHVADYTPPDTGKPGVEILDKVLISVKNFGRTPANQVQIIARWFAMPAFHRPPRDSHCWRPFRLNAESPVRQTWSRPTIFPDQVRGEEVSINDLSPLQSALAGTGCCYLYGEISYIDISGQPGSTEFCFIYYPNRPAGKQFAPYEEHNEAR